MNHPQTSATKRPNTYNSRQFEKEIRTIQKRYQKVMEKLHPFLIEKSPRCPLFHGNSKVIQRLLATISKANHASRLVYIQSQRQPATQLRQENYLLRKSYQENHQSPLDPPSRKRFRLAVYAYYTTIKSNS